MIADEYDISRQDLDEFGAQSQQRAAQATAEGRFENEMPPGGAVLTLPADPGQAGAPRFLPDPASQVADLCAALHDPELTLYVTTSGVWTRGQPGAAGGEPLMATIPPVDPAELGDPSFCEAHGVAAAYVAGAMAGGIASPELVIAMSRARLLAFFGAGGLDLRAIEAAVKTIKAAVGDGPAGFNLLHSPNEPAVEEPRSTSTCGTAAAPSRRRPT